MKQSMSLFKTRVKPGEGIAGSPLDLCFRVPDSVGENGEGVRHETSHLDRGAES